MPDEEKNPGGRPAREDVEPFRMARLYASDVDRMNDIARWRRVRLGKRDYSIADLFRDSLRDRSELLWREELAAKEGTSMTPTLLPVAQGRFELPFVGDVAAGSPLEIFEQPAETFSFSDHFGGEGRYVFRVRGNSMADEGIRSGDYAVIRRQPAALPGEDVVASVDGELTLKRLVAHRGTETILTSCDGEKRQIRMDSERDRILGVLLGVVRKGRKRH